MRAIVLDLETVPDQDVPFTPPEDKPDAFPPPPHHEIVAFGVLCWDDEGPRRLMCLGHDERSSLVAFSKMLTSGTQLITFNGRNFDLPVIVARCFKHSVTLRQYFVGRGYRYRFTDEGHLDLRDQLSDYGWGAGLGVWGELGGFGGKGDVDGSMVADLWAQGEHERIKQYCLDDVALTARIWLRYRYLSGAVPAAVYKEECDALDNFLKQHAQPEQQDLLGVK